MNLNFLKTLAPWIGAAATGNVPALIGMAAETVSKAVGHPVESSTDAIASAVAGATPEQLQALKDSDNDFKLKMNTLNITDKEKMAEIFTSDIQNARQREVSLKDKYLPFLASFVVASFTTAVVAVLIGKAKVEAAFAGTLIGYLSGLATQVISYYFGSSAAHDELVASNTAKK